VVFRRVENWWAFKHESASRDAKFLRYNVLMGTGIEWFSKPSEIGAFEHVIKHREIIHCLSLCIS
jgi:hypothetical protein